MLRNLIVVAIVLSFLFVSALSFSGNGSGTESDPYQIKTVEQLHENEIENLDFSPSHPNLTKLKKKGNALFVDFEDSVSVLSNYVAKKIFYKGVYSKYIIHFEHYPDGKLKSFIKLRHDITEKKVTITYNDKGLKKHSTNEFYKDDTLCYQTRSVYEYDDNGKLLKFYWQNWDGEEWKDEKSLSTYSYDENNNLIRYLHHGYQGDDLTRILEMLFFYDTHGILIQEIYNDWGVDMPFISYRYTYSYDNNNRIDSIFQEERKGIHDENWRIRSLETLEYDYRGNLIVDDYKDWSMGKWKDWYRYTYEYDIKSNLTLELHQYTKHSVSDTLVNSERYSYSYNYSQGKMVGKVEKYEDEQWDELYTKFYFNDAAVSNPIWIYSNKIEVEFEPQYTSVEDSEVCDNLISIHPNPSNDIINISSREIITQVKVINILGNTVKELNQLFEKNIQVNVADLPAGYYFVNIMIDGRSESYPIIIY